MCGRFAMFLSIFPKYPACALLVRNREWHGNRLTLCKPVKAKPCYMGTCIIFELLKIWKNIRFLHFIKVTLGIHITSNVHQRDLLSYAIPPHTYHNPQGLVPMLFNIKLNIATVLTSSSNPYATIIRVNKIGIHYCSVMNSDSFYPHDGAS